MVFNVGKVLRKIILAALKANLNNLKVLLTSQFVLGILVRMEILKIL